MAELATTAVRAHGVRSLRLWHATGPVPIGLTTR